MIRALLKGIWHLLAIVGVITLVTVLWLWNAGAAKWAFSGIAVADSRLYQL